MKKLVSLGILSMLVASIAVFTRAHASGKSAASVASSSRRSTLDLDDAVACTNESLEGVYGLSISGTRPAPPSPTGTQNYIPGTIEQLIGVGTRTFDGDGNFTQVTNEKGSLSGNLFPNRALNGTYTINSDCSGTLNLIIPTLPRPITYDIVVVSHGREFLSIVDFPPTVMVTTSGRKVR